jgi:regulator of replication initiation timing
LGKQRGRIKNTTKDQYAISKSLRILRFCIFHIACGRDDDRNTENDIEHGNEGDNGENINENYNQQINDMKKKLDASEEHNISLISDKEKLERDLSREKIKFTQAEEKIGNLERELAEKKRRWEAEEKELHETITKLRAVIKPKPDTSCQSIAATSFANVVSSEGDYLIQLITISHFQIKYYLNSRSICFAYRAMFYYSVKTQHMLLNVLFY